MSAHQNSPMDVPVRQVDPRHFAIVLVPVAIFVSEALIGGLFMPTDLDVPVSILQEDRGWLEAAGRYRFLAATWFYGAMSILVAAFMIRTLTRPTAPKTRIAAICTFLLVFVLAILPTLLGTTSAPDSPKIYDHLGSAVYEAVLAQGTLPGCDAPGDMWFGVPCGEAPVLTMFNRVVDMVNVFAGLSIGAMIVNMVLCLDNRPCASLEDKAALYAENLRHMRQQLYVSGLILTFGMLFVASWVYWPQQSVIAAERGAYSAILLSSALYTGTYFSLLLLSFYLPVALILDGWVKTLAEQAAREDPTGAFADIETWRKARGLTEGAGDYIRAGLAVTAPILAAFAGGISPLSL